jgi:hypothetical protein
MYRLPLRRPAALLAAVVILAGCEVPTRTIQSDFPIVVDDVDVPQTIRTTDPLPVRVMGVIGDSDCYSLLRVDILWAEERDEVLILPMGRLETGARTCQPQQVLLNEEVVLEPPFQQGELGVNVPATEAGETLRYSVQVVAPDAD